MSKEEALRRIKEAAETGATKLGLAGKGLTELPPELFELKNLTELTLRYNQLSKLPPEFFELKNFTVLNLSHNQLISLPPEVVQLKNLTLLNLNGNQLASLPLEIVQLKNLTRLDLIFNQLISLPPEIVQLPNLEELELKGNPLISPPYELAIQGLPAIREYFAALEEGGQELAEVKIILVGEGASGKTSLTRCLRGQCFNEHEETTHGIRIKDWQIDTPERLIRCKLWDFGGQEIMHATHQFFLSRRCLYVLVLDGRRDERPEYWLRYIESFGGGSPVLVVLNKYDSNPSFDLNRPFLQEKYPFIKGFWRTSCKTGNLITEFKEALREELTKVPLIKNQWPASWFRAKARLEEMNEPRISYEEFEAACREAGVQGEISRNVLVDFLHDLGAVIHFKEFELEGHHVLDPKWVTNGVYKIINAESVAAAKGLLNKRALRELLRWQEGDEHRYEWADHNYLIELMKKFELCYELAGDEVLIPQLLAVSEPSFTFDEQDALRLTLHYEDFFPPSIMPRFIVKRHQEIKDELRWRTGVVLKHPLLEATAVVRADNEARRIQIMVTDKERKVFLALIWLTFRELHTSFEGLKVSERIPLPDNPALSVAYETLLNYAKREMKEIIPEGTDEAYSVKELLAGVHFDSQSEGERMLALAEGEREGGLMNRLANGLNTAVKLEPSIFGVGINLNGVFDAILNRKKK